MTLRSCFFDFYTPPCVTVFLTPKSITRSKPHSNTMHTTQTAWYHIRFRRQSPHEPIQPISLMTFPQLGLNFPQLTCHFNSIWEYTLNLQSFCNRATLCLRPLAAMPTVCLHVGGRILFSKCRIKVVLFHHSRCMVR